MDELEDPIEAPSRRRPTWRSLVARVREGLAAAREGWGAFVTWFNGLGLTENGVLLGFAVAIGLLGGGGVVLFYRLIDLAFAVFYRWTGEVVGREVLAVYRPIITALGFMAAWAMIRGLRGKAGGENVAAVQLAVARQGAEIPARVGLVRTAAAAVTLGAGGSAGSEGPVAVLGATVGSWLGKAFRSDPARMPVLVGAGAAAGISASFNAPLAGAFFALEEVLGSLSVASFPPVVVSSVIAAVVSQAALGNHPAFPIPMEYGFALKREVFLFYPILGVIAGLAAVLFVRVFFGTQNVVQRLRLPGWGKAALGGLSVGVLVWLSGGVLAGYGHLAIRLEVFGRMAWTALALLAVGKILATSVTLATAGAGGVFTPSLFVGAATGGAFGVALSHAFPGLGLHPEAYALVGMAAVVAATTHAPITALLIVFEMTGDYAIILPLMLATVIATVVARHVEPDSLYSGWLRRRGQHLEHGADRDVLAGLRVADAYDRNPRVIGEGATAAQLGEHLDRADRAAFPVVDDGLCLVGVLTLADLARVARDPAALHGVVIAADLASETETVGPDDTLLDAVQRMGVRGAEMLPVVGAEGRLLGTLARADVLAAYQRAVAGGAHGHESRAHSDGPPP